MFQFLGQQPSSLFAALVLVFQFGGLRLVEEISANLFLN